MATNSVARFSSSPNHGIVTSLYYLHCSCGGY